jgi:hypothetical protein
MFPEVVVYRKGTVLVSPRTTSNAGPKAAVRRVVGRAGTARRVPNAPPLFSGRIFFLVGRHGSKSSGLASCASYDLLRKNSTTNDMSSLVQPQPPSES